MNPRDIAKQLIGTYSGWDQQDTSSFTFYEITYNGVFYDNVFIDYERGYVAFYLKSDDEEPTFRMAIKAELVPISEDFKL